MCVASQMKYNTGSLETQGYTLGGSFAYGDKSAQWPTANRALPSFSCAIQDSPGEGLDSPILQIYHTLLLLLLSLFIVNQF